MANLIKELGADYCNDMLSGAGFLYEGHPHILTAVTHDLQVIAQRCSTNPDKPEPKEVTLAPVAFVGWSAFAFPTLGYRMAGNGQILAYLSRINSVRRGLNQRDLHTELHDVSYECSSRFGIDVRHYVQNHTKMVMALSPTYLSFFDGLKKVMAGEIPAFAMSADFAIAPSDSVPFLEILFRERRIGTINENGVVDITIPKIKHSWDETVKGVGLNEQN